MYTSILNSTPLQLYWTGGLPIRNDRVTVLITKQFWTWHESNSLPDNNFQPLQLNADQSHPDTAMEKNITGVFCADSRSLRLVSQLLALTVWNDSKYEDYLPFHQGMLSDIQVMIAWRPTVRKLEFVVCDGHWVIKQQFLCLRHLSSQRRFEKFRKRSW